MIADLSFKLSIFKLYRSFILRLLVIIFTFSSLHSAFLISVRVHLKRGKFGFWLAASWSLLLRMGYALAN